MEQSNQALALTSFPPPSTEPGSGRIGKKKRRHPKSREGCLTCKSRRIKCDEQKPSCLRCLRSNRICQGYDPPRALIFQPSTKLQFDTPRESRSFQYYLEKSVPNLSRYRNFIPPFVTNLSPQASHHHSSVKHMLIALAALHESMECKYVAKAPLSQVEAVREFALVQYTKAINHLTNPGVMGLPPEIVLSCCLLFTIFEFFRYSPSSPYLHFHAAMRILSDYKESRPAQISQSSSEVIESQLLPIFSRFGIIGATYADDFAPKYSFLVGESATYDELLVPEFFDDIFQAYEHLDGLFRCIIRNTTGPLTPAKQEAIEQIKISMPNFLETLKRTQELPVNILNTDFENAARAFKVHHIMAEIMLESLLVSDEMLYDSYTDVFEHIVAECDALIDMNLVANLSLLYPLFFIASKCRLPRLRQRAVHTMHKALRRERLWSSCTAVQIAKEIIKIEAQGLSDQSEERQEFVPKLNRIILIGIELEREHNRIRLRYAKYPFKTGEEVETHTMPWAPDRDSDRLDYSKRVKLSMKIVRAAGYSGVTLMCRSIECHCSCR